MKKIAASLSVLILVSAPTLAFLGIGDVVFDPSNYAEAVEQLSQLERQYEQLAHTYQVIQNQYQQMKWMAQSVPVDLWVRYRALTTPWALTAPTNTYGTTSAWTGGANSGFNVPGGYASAIEPLGTYGSSWERLPGDQIGRLKTNYATLELTDGANIAALQTIGDLRRNATEVDSAIDALEQDSLSSDPEMNTEIAVLNKINAADVIGLHNGQNANKVLVALAEQQVVHVKLERDAAARAFNQHIGFVTNAQNLMSAQTAGASAAMQAWRMP